MIINYIYIAKNMMEVTKFVLRLPKKDYKIFGDSMFQLNYYF